MSEITIKKVTEYTDELGRDLQRLMEILTPRAKGKTVDKKMMEDIIKSPFHDQYIAVDENGKVVGAITFSEVLGPFVGGGRTVFMEDFVVDPDAQGGGIGSKLFQTLIDWSREHGAKKIEFTSRQLHEGSHDFYAKRGAKKRDSHIFRLPLDDSIVV
jgi:GNAT superfamily N-acetyltransferase